jgi:hypothetical protein
MQCWKCYFPVKEKIGFRSECEKCGSYLHVCKNCQNYAPGKANDCLIAETELVKDREMINYCDEFKPLKSIAEQKKEKKNPFDSLFKDK